MNKLSCIETLKMKRARRECCVQQPARQTLDWCKISVAEIIMAVKINMKCEIQERLTIGAANNRNMEDN